MPDAPAKRPATKRDRPPRKHKPRTSPNPPGRPPDLFLTINDVQHIAVRVARRNGISARTFYLRVEEGWDIFRAATAPTRAWKRKDEPPAP